MGTHPNLKDGLPQLLIFGVAHVNDPEGQRDISNGSDNKAGEERLV
jgi:hypothetical protein